MAERHFHDAVCVLCREQPSSPTGEHVWPKWFIKGLFPPSEAPYTWHVNGEPMRKRDGTPRRHDSFGSIKVPACTACNGILNDRFELPAKDPISELFAMHGEVRLSAEQSAVCGQWLLKTWLLYAHPEAVDSEPGLDRTPLHPVPDDLWGWMVDGSEPPAGVSAWIYRTQGGEAAQAEPYCMRLPIVHVDSLNVDFQLVQLTVCDVNVSLVYHHAWAIEHPLEVERSGSGLGRQRHRPTLGACRSSRRKTSSGAAGHTCTSHPAATTHRSSLPSLHASTTGSACPECAWHHRDEPSPTDGSTDVTSSSPRQKGPEVEQRDDPADGIMGSGVWLFLPLPHPLPIPDGFVHQSALALAESLSSTSTNFGISSSVCIHQMEPGRDTSVVELAELYAFATAVMASRDRPDFRGAGNVELILPHINEGPMRAGQTVAEVAVPGITGADESELAGALDLAIEHIRLLQRAVAMATEWPVKLIARATLPPMIPTFRAEYWTRQHHPQPEVRVNPASAEAIEWRVPGSAPPSALGLQPDPLDEVRLDRFLGFCRYLSRAAAFTMYGDLRREAMVQRGLDGNNRMALVAMATAGEVLLDTALLHMLWEEHTPPDAAAEYFDRGEGHTARVLRNFPPRLGGGWDPSAKTPAGRYLGDLVRLRHRVVHAGHEPDGPELDAAYASLLDLERFLGDRLAAESNLKRYTRTAMAWMAETGLRTRGRFTQHVQRLSTDPSEPDWQETFRRWRHHVDRCLDPAPPAPGQASTGAVLYADLPPNGRVRWIVHDRSTAYAAVIDPLAVVTSEVVDRVTRHLTAVQSNDIGNRRVLHLASVEAPVDATWQMDHEVFPELRLFAGEPTRPPVQR